MKYAFYGNSCRDTILASGIELDPDGRIALVEMGSELPRDRIAIVFDENRADELISFLNSHRQSDNLHSPEFIPCRDDERIHLVRTDEVEFFCAEGDTVQCNIRGGRTYEVKKKLYELERQLAVRGFFRVSKAYLINVLEIRDISPWFGGRLLLHLKNGRDEIEVSRKYVADFKEYLGV